MIALPRPGKLAAGIAVGAFLTAEFLVFDAETSRHQAWIFPRWNDQIQYLSEAYTGYEFARIHGILPGLWQTLVKPSAQGMLSDFLAVAVFWGVTPSRSAALALNMAAWIGLQFAFYSATVRAFGSRCLAWIAVGLLACWHTPLSLHPGSATDFRLDFMAACAFGVALMAAARTDGFGSRRAALAFGCAVGATLLIRFLTGTYFVVIFAGLSVWLLTLPRRGRRLLNLGLAALVAAALAGPVFWLNRAWVWNYYFIGHFTGPESAIRNAHMGVLGSLEFVGRRLLEDHLQTPFVATALGVTTALGGVAALAKARGRPPAAPMAPQAVWLVPAALFTAAPLLVLTLHNQKSSVVLSIVVPGIAALLLGGWAELWRRARPALPVHAADWMIASLAGLAVAHGGWSFVGLQRTDRATEEFTRDARKVNTVADSIFTASRAEGWTSPRIAVDQVTDCLDGQVLRVICYERHHAWIPFVMTLPTGIMAEREEVMMERLAQSDFAFICIGDPRTDGYPYDREMRALRPKTLAWCEAHLRLVERFPLFGSTWALYRRTERAN